MRVRKYVIVIALVSLMTFLFGCKSDEYKIMNSSGDIQIIDVSEMREEQKLLIKDLSNGDKTILEAIESGVFSDEEFIVLDIIDETTLRGIRAAYEMQGVEEELYINPLLIIKLMEGTATQDDIQELLDNGMTQEEIDSMLISSEPMQGSSYGSSSDEEGSANPGVTLDE